MAGKAGKKKKGKKKGANEMPHHIAGALMPSVSLAAVPRTPPPPSNPPESGFGLSSALLNSSMLGRMFATPEPGAEEVPVSDTDTSLYDYQHSRELGASGYAGVEMRHGARPRSKQDRFTYSDRERVPTPTDEMYSDGEVPPGEYYELEQGAPAEYAASTQANIRYGHPRKEPYGDSAIDVAYVPGTSSQELYDPDAIEDQDRIVPSTSGLTGSQPGMGRVEAGLLQGSSPGSLPEFDEPRSKQLAMETSLVITARTAKLNSLIQQNEELLAQQKAMEEQLRVQSEQQEAIMQRIEEKQEQPVATGTTEMQERSISEMSSLLHDTKIVTDKTLRKQNTLITTVMERSKVLEEENKNLEVMNQQLQLEINSLRNAMSAESARPGESDRSTGRRNLDYKEECRRLKEALHRANVELSQYQGTYRKPTIKEKDMVGLPSKGPIPSWLINTKYLSPLFLAYDDRLAQKDTLLHQYQTELDGFKRKLEDIVRENTRLHLQIEQADRGGGPASMTEWRQLQEQAKLVLEENQLLMQQLDLQQLKAREQHQAHIQEVARLSHHVVDLESRRETALQELNETKTTLSQIKTEYTSVAAEDRSKVSMQEHVQALADIKKDMAEENLKHVKEVENLTTQLQTKESEKRTLSDQMKSIAAENKVLQGEIEAVQKENRKAKKKLMLLETALSAAEAKQISCQHYLSSMVRVANKTAQERDSFAHQVDLTEHQTSQMMKKLMDEKSHLGNMEENMKLYQDKMARKVEGLNQKLKEQSATFGKQRHEYEREIKHLKLLLQEQMQTVEIIDGEKKCIENDIELIWKASTAENQRMKEALKKSGASLNESLDL